MKRMLLIVDPQIDFISGTLPVPKAAEAMDALAEYLAANDGRYACKVVTTDYHPYDHCSFARNGGQWPDHCIQHTAGSAIYQPLIKPLYETVGSTEVLCKGTNTEKEEYSIFQNTEAAKRIDSLVHTHGIEQIEICGLAGDICVRETLSDGEKIYGSEMFHLLEEFSPILSAGTQNQGH